MRQRTRVTVVIVEGNRVLLVREDAPDSPGHAGPDGTLWQLPGGGLEAGESIFEAARREALEETGLEVEPERVDCLQEFIRPRDAFHQIEIYVLATVLAGTPTVPENDHVLEIRAFNRQEAAAAPLDIYILPEFWDELERGFPEFRFLGASYAR